MPGVSHVIHTYMEDENLSSFACSPVLLGTPSDMESCLKELEGLLSKENTVSVLVRSGEEERIINLKEDM